MNSVRLELFKIDRQWYDQVKGHADKPLFVCLGEKHRLKLFDAYFKSHSADGMESHDLFLMYYRPPVGLWFVACREWCLDIM